MKLSAIMRRTVALHTIYQWEHTRWELSLAEPHLLPAIVVMLSKYEEHPMPPASRNALRNFLFSQPVAVIYALASLRDAHRPRHRWDFWKDYERLQKEHKRPDQMVQDLIEDPHNLLPAFRAAVKKLARKGRHVDQLL